MESLCCQVFASCIVEGLYVFDDLFSALLPVDEIRFVVDRFVKHTVAAPKLFVEQERHLLLQGRYLAGTLQQTLVCKDLKEKST